MRVLSTEETALWCSEHEIALSDSGLPLRPDAAGKFKIPEDANKRVHLVSQGMRAFNAAPRFLVWFHDWAVWPSGQRMHIFDRFRISYGETRLLIDSPGHIFEQGEIEDAISFVTIAVLFLWDCYVVTPRRSEVLFFSHDEYGLAKGINMGAIGA
jgi:hypothetical protein